MTGRVSPALVAMGTALTLACSTAGSYSPREPGRIHFIKTSSGRALEKDGKLYSMSSLSSDPVKIVEGDPAAEEHARAFVGGTRTAEILLVVGGALALSAGIVAGASPEKGRVAYTAMGCTAMASVLGAVMMVPLSRHHLYDAVNIYNDDLSMRPADSK